MLERLASRVAPFLEPARARRGRRALERQLEYQRGKALRLKAADLARIERSFAANTARLVGRLERHRSFKPADRIVEVGAGAHGHVFFMKRAGCVGVDPLAAHYRSLFPHWQGRVPTVAAVGERLPFPDNRFDVVLSDNVVDHAPDPAQIIRELVRVLAPGGLLYFTVHVHHPAYALMSHAQLAAFALRVPVEVPAFSDHTFHFTPSQAAKLHAGLPLDILEENLDVEQTLAQARKTPPRHVADRLKRYLYKNATYELIARKR